MELAKEMGGHRQPWYGWHEKLKPLESTEGPAAISREATLRKEASRLKRVLAEKILEVLPRRT